MRTILLALFIAALPVSAAPAQQQLRPQKTEKPAASGTLLPLKRASGGNSCAAFGPGFVKVEGSDSCVRIGGTVSIGAGVSGGGR
jgi:hypothetical protein